MAVVFAGGSPDSFIAPYISSKFHQKFTPEWPYMVTKTLPDNNESYH